MKKETVANIIEELVINVLKARCYIEFEKILNEIDSISNDEDDSIEIAEIISNSKKFNYILLQNGESYIVGKDILSWLDFFKNENISDNDDIWLNYFYFDKKSMMLRDIFDEINTIVTVLED